MNKYGFLIYKKDKTKTARFNINKQIIRIGSDKINDIRLKKPFNGSLCLTIRKSKSSNAYSYIFNVDEANESILINDKIIVPNTDILLKNGDSIKILDIEFTLQIKKRSIPSRKFMDAFAGPISSSKRKSIKASTRRRSSVSNPFSIKDVNQDDLIVNQPLNPLINFDDSKVADKDQFTLSSSMTITNDAFVTAKSIMDDKTGNTVIENSTLDSTLQNDTGFVTAFPSSFQTVDRDQSLKNQKESSINNTIENADCQQEKPIENEEENNIDDSKNDTFEVDPDKSLLKLTPTPPESIKSVPSTPKSNLKQKSEIKSSRKSVCFNEFIEENRTEYDKRTGKFLSSQKISKRLFPNIDEQDEIGQLLGHFDDDNKVKSNTVDIKTSDKVSKTPLSWSRIPRLYPIKTDTPSSPMLINLKSPKISLKKNNTVNLIKVTPISKIKKSESIVSNLTPISSETKVSSVSSINNKIIDTETNQLITLNNNNDNSIDHKKKENFELESTIVQDRDNTFINIDEQKSLYSKIEISSYEPSIDLDKDQTNNQILQTDLPNSLTIYLNDTEEAIQSLNESKSSDDNDETNFYSFVEQPKTPVLEFDNGKKKAIQNSSKTPTADYETNVDFAIKKLEQPKTPAADFEANVDFGIKKLEQPKTPAADYESNVDFAIKKLEQPKTPAADYESNVDFGIKKLEQPKTPAADYESNVDFAIKKLDQPKTPAADYETNVDWAIKKLEQPKTPAADYESNVDFGIKKLEQPKTPAADYETNVDWAIKKLEQPKTPVADYKTNIDWAIKKLDQPKTPAADYESNVDWAIKKLEQPKTPAADYESNVDWAIKKINQSKTPTADYETNIDWAIKKLQQHETPLADYQTEIDFGLKKLTERQTLSEYDCNLSMVQELFDTSETDSNQKTEEFSTPIKRVSGRNIRKKNLEFPPTEDIDSNRRLTRSAVKAKIQTNTTEKPEKKSQPKEDTKENKKPPVRRRKKIKDEIESLLESDDDYEKPDLPDIKKLTENLASYAGEDSGDDGQQIKSSGKARAARSRGTKNGIRGKKKTTADVASSINVLEMQDDQLMDVNDMKEELIVKKNTRKRKATTVVTAVNDDSDDKSMIEVKKPATRGRGRKKQQSDPPSKESEDQLEKEKIEVIQNCKNIKSTRSKIILPKKDYKMKLTENNEEEEMSNFDDSNKQFDSDIDIVNTRSRCRRTRRT